MIGETVGNFEIIAQLGKGGMGTVYLAQHLITKTKAAIKVLQADISTNTSPVQRFFNEQVAVSQIHHSGIVKISDCGYLADGKAYLVMEYLQGETLTNRIKARQRLSVADVADYGRQIASVLEATHGAGITHRDLKPDNIYLVRDAELARGERVKVLDFGIAYVQPAAGPRMTSLNASSIGTPNYMSPEQWHSLADVDWRTDAYALGCVAFEMACGRPPFIGDSMADVCAQHLGEPPPVPSKLVPGLPPQLDSIVLRLLEKEPAARPTMREVMSVFSELGHGEGIALTTLPPSTIRSPFARPSPLPTALETSTTVESPVAALTLPPMTAAQPPMTAVHPPVTPMTALQPTAKKSRLGMILVLAVLLVGGGVAAAVVLSSGGSSTTTAEGSAGSNITPAAAVDATSLIDTQVAAAPADAAIVEPLADATQVAAIVDAGLPQVEPKPTPAQTIPRAPPSGAVTLNRLPTFDGKLPRVTKTVTLKVCFDTKGRVVTISSAEPYPTAIEKTVRAWTIQPYKRDGVAVPVCGPIRIRRNTDATVETRDPPPEPEGLDKLSDAEIQSTVQARAALYLGCNNDGAAKGSVRIDVSVAPDGTPSFTGSSQGFQNREFRDCVAGHIAGLKFRATKQGGKAATMVMFKPETPDY